MKKKTRFSKKRKYIIIAVLALLVLSAGFAAFYFSIFGNVMTNSEVSYIYIDNDDNIDSVRTKLEECGHPSSMQGFNILNHHTDYEHHIRIGRYEVSPTTSMLTIFRNLRNGQQTPVKLVVPSVRTVDALCDKLAKHLMLNGDDIRKLLTDEKYIRELGFTKETLPAMFIPNTYEVYWTTDAQKLISRLKSEYDNYWNEDRLSYARNQNLTPVEVSTLASIVDSETSRDQDKPIIAGLYLNRLKKHIRLASDPTVVFAVGDFSLRRVLHRHLEIESPYNTYKHEGLPPGPIRISSVAGLESVLHPDDNDYIYMCAKEDFSGEHYYTSSETEHMANAKKYAEALNRRNIH